jgi:hypothetical protein
MSTEYKRYLDRLNHIVFVEVVPKMAVFDYFTAHAPPVDNESTETLLWFIRSGLHSDITFSLFRLIDEHGGRNIYDFLKYTNKYFRTIPWKTPLTQAERRWMATCQVRALRLHYFWPATNQDVALGCKPSQVRVTCRVQSSSRRYISNR